MNWGTISEVNTRLKMVKEKLEASWTMEMAS